MRAKQYKLVLSILDELSVRTEFGRLYLVDDHLDNIIGEALDKDKVKNVRKWALDKMKKRYNNAIYHAEYHQEEADKLNMEAGRLATLLNRIIE